jgi:hypothetical protein
MKKIFDIIKELIERLTSKSHGEQGCVFMSGANTITGNFYGFSVGGTLPDSIVVTTINNKPYKLNAANLTITDDIVSYVSTGDYLPIQFTSITTTGSGFLVLWYK